MAKNNDNVAIFSDQATIKEQAASWLVRIDGGKLNSDETAEFQEWLGRSQFHRQYIEKLALNWDSMAGLQELAELFPFPESEMPGKNSQPKTSITFPHFFSGGLVSLRYRIVLSCSATALCLVAMIAFITQQPHQKNFITAIGEQAIHELEDGSQISLNTNSRIEVDYTGDLRVIHLLQGEASFDVAKNPERPFVVYAGEGMVWAVGTAFNVRYTSDVVDVTVTEGIVKVYAEQQSLTVPLKSNGGSETKFIEREAFVDAGQSVTYSDTIRSHEPAEPAVLEQKLAWQQGRLVFKGETLEEALTEISRYTDKELIIVDAQVKDIQIGGYFKTSDIDGLLATLSKGFDIEVSRPDSNHIYFSSKNRL